MAMYRLEEEITHLWRVHALRMLRNEQNLSQHDSIAAEYIIYFNLLYWTTRNDLC